MKGLSQSPKGLSPKYIFEKGLFRTFKNPKTSKMNKSQLKKVMIFLKSLQRILQFDCQRGKTRFIGLLKLLNLDLKNQ